MNGYFTDRDPDDETTFEPEPEFALGQAASYDSVDLSDWAGESYNDPPDFENGPHWSDPL
jgi:hypothetical protein